MVEFGKVRYRGLQKNATRAFTALALANIFLARRTLHRCVHEREKPAQKPDSEALKVTKPL